jgi:hypothetical protein
VSTIRRKIRRNGPGRIHADDSSEDSSERAANECVATIRRKIRRHGLNRGVAAEVRVSGSRAGAIGLLVAGALFATLWAVSDLRDGRTLPLTAALDEWLHQGA